MSDCPNRAKNLEFCTCTYDCPRRGLCCECVAYHHSKGQIPGCFFTKEGEATWDRSIRKLCSDRGLCD